MQSTVNLQAIGLFTEPNQLNTPDGALSQATNVIIKRDNLIEPRRGFGLFGTTFGGLGDRLKQLFTYKTRLLRFWGNSLEFDTGTKNNAGDELFEAFDGSITEAKVGLRTKSVESNGNFYFTSNEGIKKISALTPSQLTTDPGFVTNAGGIKALDIEAEAVIAQGDITGFLPQDSTVAYRAVWGTIDNNKNLILGVPSQRAEVFLSLNDLLILDANNVLQALNNVGNQPSPNNSLITATDFISTLALNSTALPADVLSNLIALAAKLDNELLFANDSGSAPLKISAIDIQNNTALANSNVVTITFSVGNPTNYWIAGSKIFLTGFPSAETGDINGAQVINTVTSTTITFLTAATGNSQTFNASNVNTGTSTITINNHGFNNHDPVRFTTSGTLPSPLVAGTTYYIGNVTTNTFQVYTDQPLTSQVTLTTTGTGTSTVTFFFPVLNTSINSNEFRSIAQPGSPDVPATDDQLVALQTYLKNIMFVLQSFPTTGTPPIISAFSQSNYISILTTTTSANVKLTITIPQAVTPNYFLQLYRSPTLSATGTTPLSELSPSDELQQVFEGFPTAQDLANGFMTVNDSTPDAFLGANLYTNEASGVGIVNANEIPPLALDVTKFKNVVFYANTRTKYRMSLNLLGVSKMVESYNMGHIPQLVISDGITTNIYSFVLGIQQETQVQTVADVSDSLNGKYFLITTGNNGNTYYIWYKTSGGVTSDPMVPNATGIEVFINTNDSANTVASKTNDAIAAHLVDFFISSVSTNTVTITALAEGYTDNSLPGTSGFVVTTPISGQGQKFSRVTGNFSTVADVSGSLAGTYFTVTSPFNKIEYYIWYKVSGVGTDPLVPNATGIQINISTNDTAATVASKTATQLDAFKPLLFVASNPSSNTLIVSPSSYGPANNPTVGTSGFTLNSTSPGFLQVLLSNKVSAAQAVDETARSLVEVINRNVGESVYAFYLSQASTIPGEMTIESRTFLTPKYYFLANNADTGSSFNPDLTPEILITSISTGGPLSNLVTSATPHGLTTGDQIIISNTDSTPSADGVYTITYVSATSFRINTTILSPATRGAFTSAVDANGGDDEVKINRIYYSQFQQPEAVPLPNTIDVGDQDKAILRILPLRNSLFVFKEDGLFRISGEVAPFTLQLFDTSCVLIAPDSLSVAKNIAYGWTTQGILSVIESGVSNPPVSRPIDVNILPLTDQNYPNFSTATWGVGYDSDNSYIVYTVSDPSDTEATIAYRYGDVTQSWTTFDKTNTCGIVNDADDKLYLGAGDINSIEQERKSYTRYDYADREYTTQIGDNTYSGNVIKLPSVSNFSVGDMVTQDQYLTVYIYNALLEKLDIDLGLQINNITSITTGFTPTITTSGNHLLVTGNFATISGTMTTPIIDGTYQVTVLNPTQFQITVPNPILTGGSVGKVRYSYFNTLKIAAGAKLETAVLALVNRFNSESSLRYNTQSYTITSNSASNPSLISLSTSHNLGDPGTVRTVRIAGNVGSIPSINGDHDVIVVDPTTLSININVTVSGSGGTLTTLDDYLSAVSPLSGSITDISIANPTIITSANHGMVSNRYIAISGSNSSPVVDGNYTVTIIDPNTFSIPVSVLIEGTSGSWSTNDGTFLDIFTNFNYIINTLNRDPGVSFKNYVLITGITKQETTITAINGITKEITIAQPLDFVIGDINIFKAISSSFTYSPVTFKDALNLKQVSEATIMFETRDFTSASVSFSSDLIPNFISIPVPGDGNGSFGIGIGKFGGKFFGGTSNSAPFRTYIPRYAQRCRYIVPRFSHSTAFEKYTINGLSLTGTISQSSRAYR